MRHIVFIDTVCYKPYTGNTLRDEPLGGTEATVIRVAEGLSKDYAVVVLQHNAKKPVECNNVLYGPLEMTDMIEFPLATISIREPKNMPYLKDKFSSAKRLEKITDNIIKISTIFLLILPPWVT